MRLSAALSAPLLVVSVLGALGVRQPHGFNIVRRQHVVESSATDASAATSLGSSVMTVPASVSSAELLTKSGVANSDSLSSAHVVSSASSLSTVSIDPSTLMFNPSASAVVSSSSAVSSESAAESTSAPDSTTTHAASASTRAKSSSPAALTVTSYTSQTVVTSSAAASASTAGAVSNQDAKTTHGSGLSKTALIIVIVAASIVACLLAIWIAFTINNKKKTRDFDKKLDMVPFEKEDDGLNQRSHDFGASRDLTFQPGYSNSEYTAENHSSDFAFHPVQPYHSSSGSATHLNAAITYHPSNPFESYDRAHSAQADAASERVYPQSHSYVF